MTEQIKIIEIDEKSPHLQAVIELGDANRKTSRGDKQLKSIVG